MEKGPLFSFCADFDSAACVCGDYANQVPLNPIDRTGRGEISVIVTKFRFPDVQFRSVSVPDLHSVNFFLELADRSKRA
jgi:hypothetical protein